MSRIADVPVNLIAGPLGAGKTTCILHLLARRRGGRWAVLVNDFGAAGVDGAILGGAAEGVTVREVAGGCMCCARGVETRVALTRLLREARPERLLIEPSGLGHPAGILDLLHSPDFAGVLRPRAVICLLDPRTLDPEAPALREMARLADVLLANKSDLASAAELAAFERFAGELYPPRQVVASTAHGLLDPAWLDLDRPPPPAFVPLPAAGPAPERTAAPLPGGAGERFIIAGADGAACGWVFPPTRRFDPAVLDQALAALLAQGGVARAKGVLRVGSQWLLLNWAGGLPLLVPAAWRRDSRVEILARPGAALPVAAWEEALLAALRPD